MKYLVPVILFVLPLIYMPYYTAAQTLQTKVKYTRQDTLRGSNNSERSWWNVTKYDISVNPDFNTKSISGTNTISFKWLTPLPSTGIMQIDLQEPMQIDSVINRNRSLNFSKDGNTWFIKWPAKMIHFPAEEKIKIYFHGIPREAINPPWDGGWIWEKDEKGRPWMSVACQGLGASVWYPCKDLQSDEPDNGAIISIEVPDSLVAVSNGKEMKPATKLANKRKLYQWMVKSPINNYNIVPYIGKYVNFTDSFNGKKGKLDLSYWVLDYDLAKAKKQFGRDVKRMLRAFEYWFGPYPFYEDGFKLVQSPHLGMEHQSAIAYGNKFMDGYLGMDLSGSGWGHKWDYIIVHETGHEWFGNNITTNDIADMWVHEGFTMYSEVLFIEYNYGKKAANEYVRGLRRNIGNFQPLIGPYGVNQEGSGDMYNKGANLLHTIRQLIDNDSVFRKILMGLNKDFYHKTVDSKEVEAYFSKQSGKDLSAIFDQYLRKPNIPQLEYKTEGDKISYRWANCIPGFEMPVRMEGSNNWLYPSSAWKESELTAELKLNGLMIDKNFYIKVRKTM